MLESILRLAEEGILRIAGVTGLASSPGPFPRRWKGRNTAVDSLSPRAREVWGESCVRWLRKPGLTQGYEMNIGLIFRRSRPEWRQLGVLLVGLCLVTAFFALGPLYARSMIQTGLQYELAQVSNIVTDLTFTGSTPFRPQSWDLVNQQLGPLNRGLVRI